MIIFCLGISFQFKVCVTNERATFFANLANAAFACDLIVWFSKSVAGDLDDGGRAAGKCDLGGADSADPKFSIHSFAGLSVDRIGFRAAQTTPCAGTLERGFLPSYQ